MGPYSSLQNSITKLKADPTTIGCPTAYAQSIQIDYLPSYTPSYIISLLKKPSHYSDPDLSQSPFITQQRNRYKDLPYWSVRDSHTNSYISIYNVTPTKTGATRLTETRKGNFRRRIESDAFKWAIFETFTHNSMFPFLYRLCAAQEYECVEVKQ